MNLSSTTPAFVQNVPPQFLQEHQQRLAGWEAKLKHSKAVIALPGE